MRLHLLLYAITYNILCVLAVTTYVFCFIVIYRYHFVCFV